MAPLLVRALMTLARQESDWLMANVSLHILVPAATSVTTVMMETVAAAVVVV